MDFKYLKHRITNVNITRIKQRKKVGTRKVIAFLRELVANSIISEEEYVFATKFIDEAYEALGARAVYSRLDRAAAIALIALYLSCVTNKTFKRASKYAFMKYGTPLRGIIGVALRKVRNKAWVGCIHKLASINCKPSNPQELMRSSNPGLDAYLIALNQCNKTTNKLFN